MTDKEMAEKYVDALLNKDDAEINKFLDEKLGDLQLNERQAGTLLGIIKGIGICSFLAGLKAGKLKWHKVADGDLPEHRYIELEKENAELKEKLDKIRKYLVFDIFDRFKYLENLLKISQEKQEELSKCIIEQQKTTGSLTDIIYELKAQVEKNEVLW